jgi:hypothetical protein
MGKRIAQIVGFLLLFVHTALGTYIDNFDDGIFDTSIWKVVDQTGGTYYEESDGVLYVGGTGGQTGVLYLVHIPPLDAIDTVQIDYSWISCPGHKARFGIDIVELLPEENEALPLDNDIMLWAVKHDWYGSQHAICFNQNVDGTSVVYDDVEPTPETGKLRIDRNDTTFTAYYWENNSWIQMGTVEHDFGSNPVHVLLFTSNSDQNPQWRLALDNFVPEPATVLLLGMGGLMILRKRRSY